MTYLFRPAFDGWRHEGKVAESARQRIFQFRTERLGFTASVSRYPDGRISELFCDNHKAGSAVGTLVRDSAIILSFALQHGADIDAIGRALCRDSQGRALGPIGAALDRLANPTTAATETRK